VAPVVLPVHDLNPLARRPYVTWLLIAVNVFVFVALEPVTRTVTGTSGTDVRSQADQVCRQEYFFDRYAAIPQELVHDRQLPGARPGPTATGVTADGVSCAPTTYRKSPALSVLFAMFLHGGWAHLLGNMLFLLIFGNNVEDRMGRLKFLLFYLVCGYAAAYGFAAVDQSSTTLVGASGAIAGVLGAYLVIFPRARVVSLLTFLFFLPVRLPAWIVLGSWFLLQAFYAGGFGLADGGGVAYGAHVVGFAVGLLLVLPFLQRLRAAGPIGLRGRAGGRVHGRVQGSRWA